MAGRLIFEQGLRGEQRPRGASRKEGNEDTPTLLILGGFSGPPASDAARGDPSGCRPRSVDMDNLDAVMKRLAPAVRLPAPTPGAAPLHYDFTSLEDFHPDTLCKRVPWLREGVALYRRLRDPAQCAAALGDFERWCGDFAPGAGGIAPGIAPGVAAGGAAPEPAEPPAAVAPSAPPEAARESDPNTFARLLGTAPKLAGTPSAASGQAGQANDPGAVAAQLVQRMLQPHVQATGATPHQALYCAEMERILSDHLRRILHHPEFQALEALWTGLNWLIQRLELGEGLQVAILDVGKAECAAGMASGAEGGASAFVGHLERIFAEGEYAAWIGLYPFAATGADLALLGGLAGLAARVEVPFIGAAEPGLFGCADAAALTEPATWQPLADPVRQQWQALRRAESAQWIGLALPRFILRLPYGKGGEPVEALPFTEVMGPPGPGEILWGHPGYAGAVFLGLLLLGQGDGDDVQEIDELPGYVYQEDGEARLLPCGEIAMTEKAVAAILAAGGCPLIGMRNRNVLRLVRWQAISDPPSPLAGIPA